MVLCADLRTPARGKRKAGSESPTRRHTRRNGTLHTSPKSVFGKTVDENTDAVTIWLAASFPQTQHRRGRPPPSLTAQRPSYPHQSEDQNVFPAQSARFLRNHGQNA